MVRAPVLFPIPDEAPVTTIVLPSRRFAIADAIVRVVDGENSGAANRLRCFRSLNAKIVWHWNGSGSIRKLVISDGWLNSKSQSCEGIRYAAPRHQSADWLNRQRRLV